MLNIFTWGKNSHQVVIEGTSFYFLYKMPVAFRLQSDKRIFTQETLQSEEHKSFSNDLAYIGRLVYLVPEEFKHKIEEAYKNAIFNGVRRITKNKLENKHVTDEQNDARISEDKIAWDGEK
jgi:hypothetical protein